MGIVTAQEMADKYCYILNVIYYVAIELSKINRFFVLDLLCFVCKTIFSKRKNCPMNPLGSLMNPSLCPIHPPCTNSLKTVIIPVSLCTVANSNVPCLIV